MDVGDCFKLAAQKVAAGDRFGAREPLREAAAQPGATVAMLKLIGRLQTEAMWFEDGLATVDNLTKIDNTDEDAWFIHGFLLLQLDRWSEALGSFERCLALCPEHADCWSYRGDALWHLNRVDESLSSSDRAIQIDPKHARAWGKRAVILDKRREYKEALEAVNKSIEYDSMRGHVWCNRGEILLSLGDTEEALDSFDQAIALDARHVKAWTSRTKALLGLGAVLDALQCSERAIEIDPNYAIAWCARGGSLVHLGRDQEAKESYDRSISIDPDSAEAWSGRGDALSNLGANEEALKSYDKAVSINPNDAEAWCHRGILFVRNAELQQSDLWANGHRSLQRAAWLIRSGFHGDLSRLIDALDRWCELPLLMRGLIEDFGVLSIGLGEEARQKLVEQTTRLPTALLTWLSGNLFPLSETERLSTTGKVFLVFGDAPRAMPHLDKLDSLSPSDLAGQLYLTWCMMECLENTEIQLTTALATAEQVIACYECDAHECYYAAHLFFLAAELQRAATAFRKAGAFAPALAMLWFCGVQLNDSQMATDALEQLLKMELKWFEQGGKRSILLSSVFPDIDPQTVQGQDDLMWLFHCYEVTEAVEELQMRFEDIAGDSETAATLLAKVERSGRHINEMFIERRHAWQAVESFAAQMKITRRQARRTRLAQLRVELRDEFAALDLEKRDNLRNGDLREHLARRLYAMNLGQASTRLDQAVVFLFMDRRLAVYPTILLVFYLQCKREFDKGQTKLHLGIIQKTITVAIVAIPLKLLGFDYPMSIAATWSGVNIVEWLAKHAHAIVSEAIRSEGGEGFPSFQEFVERLNEHWIVEGRPTTLLARFAENSPSSLH